MSTAAATLSVAEAELATLTVAEAVERYGRSKDTILRLARSGAVEAVKVDRYWLIDSASLGKAFAGRRPAQRRRVACHRPKLPSEPLLRLVDAWGGPAACGIAARERDEQVWVRARRNGWITVDAADELCIKVLGLHPAEVWGDAYYAA